jgi:hypothetical protein
MLEEWSPIYEEQTILSVQKVVFRSRASDLEDSRRLTDPEFILVCRRTQQINRPNRDFTVQIGSLRSVVFVLTIIKGFSRKEGSDEWIAGPVEESCRNAVVLCETEWHASHSRASVHDAL